MIGIPQNTVLVTGTAILRCNTALEPCKALHLLYQWRLNHEAVMEASTPRALCLRSRYLAMPARQVETLDIR
jgi:hypothetical protein